MGTTDRKHAARTTPVPAAPGRDWEEAAAGGIHTIALKRDGTWARGINWPRCLALARPVTARSLWKRPVAIWVKVWAGGVGASHCIRRQPRVLGLRTPIQPSLNAKRQSAFRRVSPPTPTGWTWASARILPSRSNRTGHFGLGGGRRRQTDARDEPGTPHRCASGPTTMADDPCLRWVVVPRSDKEDGSLWVMDASDVDPNGPNRTPTTVQFRRAIAAEGGGRCYSRCRSWR